LLAARECVICGNEFQPSETTVRRWGEQKTCSRACHTAAMHQARFTPSVRACAGCGVSIVALPGAMCSECRVERKRDQWRQKNRKRRAELRAAASEPYTLAEIAERDRYCCQLCREPVDMSVAAPDPWSPSIDHIVPLADGGDDTRANVQLAHRTCNTRKGVRGAQQLALVG
jgi:hypothetical protein